MHISNFEELNAIAAEISLFKKCLEKNYVLFLLTFISVISCCISLCIISLAIYIDSSYISNVMLYYMNVCY